MFSSEYDRRWTRGERKCGIVVGSILLVCVVAAIVSSRTLAYSLAVVFAGFLIAAARQQRLLDAIPRGSFLALSALAFIGYAGLTASWAYDTEVALQSIAATFMIAFATASMLRLIRTDTRANLLHIGEGAWIGFAVGSAYLLIELLTDQSIKRFVYNALEMTPADFSKPEYFKWIDGRIASISLEELTRNIAPVAILIWPVVAIVTGSASRRRSFMLAFVLVCIAGVEVMLGWHESSKLAFAVGAATLMMAGLAPRFTTRLVGTAWVLACLAIVPAALGAYRMDLHNADWLQYSARHRIVIWHYAAEETLKSPWTGVGARTTYLLGPAIEKQIEDQVGQEPYRTLSTHSHSIYLQTWFELGLVGAILLALLGLAFLRAIGRMSAGARAYGIATFASAAAMGATAYGMWQIWYLCMFGLAVVLMGMGDRLIATSPEMQDSASDKG